MEFEAHSISGVIKPCWSTPATSGAAAHWAKWTPLKVYGGEVNTSRRAPHVLGLECILSHGYNMLWFNVANRYSDALGLTFSDWLMVNVLLRHCDSGVNIIQLTCVNIVSRVPDHFWITWVLYMPWLFHDIRHSKGQSPQRYLFAWRGAFYAFSFHVIASGIEFEGQKLGSLDNRFLYAPLTIIYTERFFGIPERRSIIYYMHHTQVSI